MEYGINCGYFKGGFAVVTTSAQIPIYIAIAIYLLEKFRANLISDTIFEPFHKWLLILLIIEFICILLMMIDFIFVQKKILEKISTSNQV